MRKLLLAGFAILLLAASTLSACIWLPADEGYRHEGPYERDRGDHHRDHHEHHDEDRDYRR